jgi:hypothetical protein
LYVSDLAVRVHHLNDQLLVVVRLSKPRETINAHYIGLLSNLNHYDTTIRYLTLERCSPRKAALCEWIADANGAFKHNLLMTNCRATEASFVEIIQAVSNPSWLYR